MIPISINTDQLVDELGLNLKQARDLIDYTVKEITASFAAEWEATAAKKLKQSRNEYVKNIQIVDEGYAKGAVVLTGWLPNAIEGGWNAFDMKEGILQGDNAKLSATGDRYNTIPYRFAVPDSIGESEVFSGKLPTEVHEIAKAQPTPITAKELPVGYNTPEVKAVPKMSPTPATWTGFYKHKAPIYQGVQKVVDPVTKQNRYVSFRRVSDNSDPSAWIHPGFQARDLAEDALNNLNLEYSVGKAVDNFLAEIGFEA